VLPLKAHVDREEYAAFFLVKIEDVPSHCVLRAMKAPLPSFLFSNLLINVHAGQSIMHSFKRVYMVELSRL
jgi:hypothetical protein